MTQPKVLVVDDDRRVSSMVRSFLSRLYEVREENCPYQAAPVAREFRPNVLILDLNMPGKNGTEVAAEFRDDLDLRLIPIVFLSGSICASECGFKDGELYVSKPVTPQALREWVQAALAKAEPPLS